MSMRSGHRGARLPYQTLAGIVPTPGGWLAATAKLQGITMAPEEPQTFRRFLDVLDYKPAYQVIAAFIPIGLFDEPNSKGRSCEQQARLLLGWPRATAVPSAPVRSALACSTYEEAVQACGGHLSPVTWQKRQRILEVDADIAPYWQRTVFEVHPELSFFQINGDKPMSYAKRSIVGRQERRQLLIEKFPGVGRILDARLRGVSQERLLDAAACLVTARRIISRSVVRLPEDPEWDSLGLRMELVR